MTPVKRDAAGFPLTFTLDSRDAQRWEEEVERMRKERAAKNLGSRVTQRHLASAPSVQHSMVTK